MTIQTGDKLPETTLVKATENGPEQVSTADYFKGRKVALFSVPGAFTPTCSAKHLPGFVDNADALKAKGIDEIVCTAVNDAFVMGAWGKNAGAAGRSPCSPTAMATSPKRSASPWTARRSEWASAASASR